MVRYIARHMRVLALGLVASLCSCAVGSGAVARRTLDFAPSSVAPGGWKQVTTPDFTLMTDLDVPSTEVAAELLSQSLTGLKAMFGKAPTVGETSITVIALKDGLEFERRFGRLAWGIAYSSERGTVLILYGEPEKWFQRTSLTYEGSQSVVTHELAHAVLRRYWADQPRWFGEGLAQYLETFRWLSADKLVLGDPNLSAYRYYRAIRSISVADMRDWKTMEGKNELEIGGLYGVSWAFVHYMRNQRSNDLGKYMARLANESPSQAWAETFAGQEDAIDKAIYAYMNQGQYKQVTILLPPAAPVPVKITPMRTEEANAALDALTKD